MQTVYAAWANPWRRFLVLLSGRTSMASKFHEYLWQNDFPRHGKRFYQEHNALVRSLVPSDRLLEYQVAQGWGPLCQFLHKDVPTRKFPNVNSIQAFRRMYAKDTRRQYLNLLKHATLTAIPFLAVTGAIYWGREIRASLKRHWKDLFTNSSQIQSRCTCQVFRTVWTIQRCMSFTTQHHKLLHLQDTDHHSSNYQSYKSQQPFLESLKRCAKDEQSIRAASSCSHKRPWRG